MSNFCEKSERDENMTQLIERLLCLSFNTLDPRDVNRLYKYNLRGENQLAYLLRESNNGLDIVSEVPLINTFVAVMSLIISAQELTEERNSVSAEITNLNNRNKVNNEFIQKLKNQRDDIEKTMKRRNGTTECPQWILNAWNNNNKSERLVVHVNT